MHGALLVEIHDAKNENLNKNRFAEIRSSYPDLDQTIVELEQFELVEFEIKENCYYLTYEGYELVERIKNPPKQKEVVQKTSTEEYNEMVNLFGSVKKFHLFITIIMLVVGVMFAIMFYMDSARS